MPLVFDRKAVLQRQNIIKVFDRAAVGWCWPVVKVRIDDGYQQHCCRVRGGSVGSQVWPRPRCWPCPDMHRATLIGLPALRFDWQVRDYLSSHRRVVTILRSTDYTRSSQFSSLCNRPRFILYLSTTLHRVSKNVPPLACYNFDTHEWILIFLGRNVTDKVGNQKTFYYAISNNLRFCTTW